tara:strand:- start:398 stop:688 length:291 start_codon:yes stop_codon:yes gene_type:complete
MKKVLLTLLFLPVLTNCGQYTAMVGPSITMIETGNIIKATSSLSSSLAINSAKQNFINEVNNNKICPTVHSAELNAIFFETLEQSDCFYDPMSIYR